MAEGNGWISFRDSVGVMQRVEVWRLQYAKKIGVDEKSISGQMAIQALLNIALTSEGIPSTEEKPSPSV